MTRKYTMILALAVIIVIAASLSYLLVISKAGPSVTSSSSSSSTTGSSIQGIVAGYVSVGPSQPSCRANQTCTETLSDFSLIFTSQCNTTATVASSAACHGQTYGAQIAPSGHYSILLPSGTYQISGLSPSCIWEGCSSTFPQAVTVEAGQQLVVNVNVDTGIR